jgi:threonine dehydratase
MTVELANWVARIEEARTRIYQLVQETPVALIEDDDAAFTSAQVYLKLEHLQRTGSFKLRGATNKILALSRDEAAKGVVTSSTGNHGLGVAAAAQYCGIAAEVYVSKQVSGEKLQSIEVYGARIRHAGATPLEAEVAARREASLSGRTYISPYNDADVIAGQGTIAAELLKQVPDMDAIYVAVGGGGLISGVGSYVREKSPLTEVVACWPQNSRVMYECLRAGGIIDFPEEPTLSQSTAGGVEAGSLTFELCQEVIDRCVLVTELEITAAMRWAHGKGWPLEGSAGVAIAAYRREAIRHRGQKVVILACGGNTAPEVLSRL